jgi:hypothetical protein
LTPLAAGSVLRPPGKPVRDRPHQIQRHGVGREHQVRHLLRPIQAPYAMPMRGLAIRWHAHPICPRAGSDLIKADSARILSPSSDRFCRHGQKPHPGRQMGLTSRSSSASLAIPSGLDRLGNGCIRPCEWLPTAWDRRRTPNIRLPMWRECCYPL